MCFHWPVRLYFGSKYVWFYILDRFTLFMQILNVIFNLSLKRCTLFLLLLFFPSPHVVVMLCSLLSVVMQRKEKELNLDFSCYFWHTGICGVILWKKWKNFFAPLSGFLVIFFTKMTKKCTHWEGWADWKKDIHGEKCWGEGWGFLAKR